MTRPSTDSAQWTMVDEGWGRKAVDFATLSEPGNCREYVTVHHRLGVDAGDRLLDMACGSGLAIELARLRGASCCGIDASAQTGRGSPGPQPRLRHQGRRHARPALGGGLVRRRDQLPGHLGHHTRCGGRDPPDPATRRTGRDHGVGSPEGIPWGVGAGAMAPGCGREGRQPGDDGVAGPAGAGEQLLASHGFVDVERLDVPFAWEFADPELFARAQAATGPGYEAIQNVGEADFHRAAVEEARRQLRDGLPLRADVNVVGYLARKPPRHRV